MAAGRCFEAATNEAKLAEFGVQGAAMGREELAEKAGDEAAEKRTASKRTGRGGVAGG